MINDVVFSKSSTFTRVIGSETCRLRRELSSEHIGYCVDWMMRSVDVHICP
ncbi:hypothetical protein [Blastomonas sp.]|uniref:hypothetical protein n=1 Tax=Blastomonas sp. TaxID=1909299 RepID=UPI003594520B